MHGQFVDSFNESNDSMIGCTAPARSATHEGASRRRLLTGLTHSMPLCACMPNNTHPLPCLLAVMRLPKSLMTSTLQHRRLCNCPQSTCTHDSCPTPWLPTTWVCRKALWQVSRRRSNLGRHSGELGPACHQCQHETRLTQAESPLSSNKD